MQIKRNFQLCDDASFKGLSKLSSGIPHKNKQMDGASDCKKSRKETCPPLMETESSSMGAPNSYVHRCPFKHCHHTLGTDRVPAPCGTSPHPSHVADVAEKESLARKILASKSDIRWLERNQHLRGVPDYRKRTIIYMINRIGVMGCKDAALRAKLQECLTNLEQKVFDSARSKDHYLNIMATKLAIILNQIKRKNSDSHQSSACPNLSPDSARAWDPPVRGRSTERGNPAVGTERPPAKTFPPTPPPSPRSSN